ncbi:MAG: DUF1684 domain-containing protein [Cytophagales bacterium]|nr:DUF1684 domain-containing protein [Cytophagales bacterium]
MSKKILFGIVAVGLLAITLYNIKGTSTRSEGYADKILAERQEKDRSFKEADDSPLSEEQKRTFEKLTYFPINEKYRITGDFHRNSGNEIVKMAITDGSRREYVVFGRIHFHLEGKELDITVYKPVKSEPGYLFVPFYDKTCADLTYGGGRYVEPVLLEDGSLEIDFNLAYNPYCAYNHKYRCPIPPQENNLDVSILAGEKIPDFIH